MLRGPEARSVSQERSVLIVCSVQNSFLFYKKRGTEQIQLEAEARRQESKHKISQRELRSRMNYFQISYKTFFYLQCFLITQKICRLLVLRVICPIFTESPDSATQQPQIGCKSKQVSYLCSTWFLPVVICLCLTGGCRYLPRSRLAQLVERKTLNLVVEGSSPSVGIFIFLSL